MIVFKKGWQNFERWPTSRYKSGPWNFYNLRREKCSPNGSLTFIAALYWSIHGVCIDGVHLTEGKTLNEGKKKFSYHHHLMIFHIGKSEKDNSFNTINIIVL